MRALIIAIASGGYVGFIPFASGTFGSLVAIPLFFWFDHLRPLSLAAYVSTYALSVALACWVAGKADAYLGEHDSHTIVIDEIVGYLAATMWLAPTWGNALGAFVVFRVFDVLKPFPAGYVDAHVPGGYGVVLDDVVSGIYTNLVMQVLRLLGALP
jgi:phosphatidylglycerophosphatase A